MHHQPFGWVECYGTGVFYSLQPSSKFRTYESTASVSSVYVQPKIFFHANDSYFVQIVERASTCGTKRGTNLKSIDFVEILQLLSDILES